ncbi:TonB-dependent receptor [Parafilimonas sp.]|uniref:TonB-dependent receptor n=1 Tax=Parafilimonas sp. TaxID=1969739 RepID=UPI003F7D3B4D
MKNFLIVCFSFLGISAMAQTKISGHLKDNRGKPVIAASITVKDSYDGTTSDSSGNFSFTTTETGAHTITVTSNDFEDYEVPVNLNGQPLTMNVSLKPKFNELKAVTVTAGSFEAGDNKRAATVLNSIDIATTAGANADITAALKTLPGAQQVGNQQGLFVRGGTGEETQQFIDGTLVNNPYYTSVPDIATRGRFSPFLFKGTVFSTGGYSALYGQALSSAVILESIDFPDSTAGNAIVSPIVVGGGIQKLSKKKNFSWGVDYNYVNPYVYFKIVKQTPDYFKMPEFHSGDANFRIKTNGGIIKYYTTFNYNHLGLRRPDIDSSIYKDAYNIINHNWYNNLSWRQTLGNGWKMNLGMSYSTNRDDISQQVQDSSNNDKTFNHQPWISKNFHLKSRQDLFQVKEVFEKRLSGLSAIRFGGEYWYGYSPNQYINIDSNYSNTLKDNYAAAFAETDIYLTNDLALKIGGRYEYSSMIKQANIAPRISMAYKTGEGGQVSMAYGIFYQKPLNNEIFYSANLGYTRATHYIVNYQKTANNRIFRVEAFYKKYHDLVKSFPTYNTSGTGFAKGAELFLRDKTTFKNVDYWISYSYLDTKRDYANYPEMLEPTFAAHHTASLVVKRFVTEWKAGFNATYTFATGRPYYNFLYNGAENKYIINDHGRTPNYNSMGISAEYLPTLGKQNAKTFIVLFVSATNVLGQKQVYGYNYSFNGLNKQAVLPPANRSYFIGCFLSWGIDRSQDAIDNNL